MKGTEDKFLYAVQKGNLRDVQEIYESSVGNEELLQCCHKKSGDRAIHLAARNNYVDVLEYIIAKGADIESGNLDGKRALHEAAQTGSLECLNLLLLKGAEVDALKRADWLVYIVYFIWLSLPQHSIYVLPLTIFYFSIQGLQLSA